MEKKQRRQLLFSVGFKSFEILIEVWSLSVRGAGGEADGNDLVTDAGAAE